ncbi:MAG: hypothetical protein OIN85_04655 [Candidatus Methanoperedens sp.]|nr:hypothetical protein [Candidatus Methanoperedens sp.]
MATELTEPITIRVSDRVSLRLYPDSRPHNLEIANLQKGVVLMQDSKELIGEGAGFGAPVVRYSDHTFFSTSARVYVCEPNVLMKSFMMDSVSRKRFGASGPYVDHIYSILHKIFAWSYLKFKCRPVFKKIIELRRTLGLRTEFVKVRSRGMVNITYTLSSSMQIKVDLTGLDTRGCKEILILNEQDGDFFRKYFDREEVTGDKIEAWRKVISENASFSDVKGSLTFALKKIKGSSLISGREHVKRCLSWSGLDYSLRPGTRDFNYTIEIKDVFNKN